MCFSICDYCTHNIWPTIGGIVYHICEARKDVDYIDMGMITACKEYEINRHKLYHELYKR